jgi:orotidine-5'-phosphate decarboxylase
MLIDGKGDSVVMFHDRKYEDIPETVRRYDIWGRM